jgi:hypothetical protein
VLCYTWLLALKRILISIVLAFAFLPFSPTSTKGDEGGFWGTVLQNDAATYVVRLDDGRFLDAEWNSGYDDWSPGDRVIMTTDEGEGYMFNEAKRTQVDIFPYDPSEIDFIQSRLHACSKKIQLLWRECYVRRL